MSLGHAATLAATIYLQTAPDCSKYSSESGSPECDQRAETAFGYMVLIALILFIVGFVAYRFYVRRVNRRLAERGDGLDDPDPSGRTHGLSGWLHAREARRHRIEARQHQLMTEYYEGLKARDPDTLEASRDWGDNDGTPWRTEVQMGRAAIFVLLGMVVVVILIGFFSLIKSLTS